jgi:peptidyl-prolyl cis-trans isomerase D
VAGTVFGTSISWEEFAVQRRWLQRQFEEQFRQAPELVGGLLTRYTWERIMLLEEAKRRRLRIDDAELVALLERQEAFQEQGRFLPERYHRYVRAAGMSPQAFEALLRDDLLIGKLLDGVKAAVVVTDADVKAAYTAAHERLNATVILFDPSAFAHEAAATITEEDVQAFYAAHPEHVRISEQIIVEYLGTSKEELVSRLQLSEDELNAYYQDHPEQFSTEKGEAKPFADVRETARQQLTEERMRKQLTSLALDFREDLEAKLRFEEIAGARALTAKTTGAIAQDAFWAAGLPDFAILQAVRSLPEGQLSEVIQTERGVYLARVVQRTPSRVPPLEEVKDQVTTRLTEERARQAAQEAAKAWQSRIREHHAAGWRFEEAALVTGTVSSHPATFTRTEAIEELGSVPAVNEAVFGAPLGSLTEIIDTPRGFVIVRPEERIPADEAGFAQQEATLREEKTI